MDAPRSLSSTWLRPLVGACRECQAGHATVCTSRENMGYQHDGGFAEFMLVPAKAIAVDGLNRIPDGTGPAEASLAGLIRRGRVGSARPARG